MNVSIPPPPLPSSTNARVEPSTVSSTKPLKPIDAAFLARTYRSMLWFGIVMTVLAAYGWGNVAATGSFVGGMVLAALLLRVQEVSLRSILRPKEQLAGFDARLLVVLLLPLKFAAIGALLWAADASGWMRPAPLALGFFAAQLVLVAKIAGWMMARRAG